MFAKRLDKLWALDTKSVINKYLFMPPQVSQPWKGTVDGMPAICLGPTTEPKEHKQARHTQQTVICFFHGNGAELSQYAEDMQAWYKTLTDTTASKSSAEVKSTAAAAAAAAADQQQQGREIFLYAYEYPGYGRLAHIKPSERVLYQHTQLVLQSLLARHPHPASTQIVLVGHSLGAAIALYAATELQKMTDKLGNNKSVQNEYPYSLVMVSPFTSVNQVALENQVPKVICALLGQRLSNFKRLSKLTAQCRMCLLVHGAEDKVIPASHSRALIKQVPVGETRHAKRGVAAKRLILLPGMGHNLPLEVIGALVSQYCEL